ncbi:MAG: RtcB family protein [Syntrophomonadaceae bacterium]|nr:RtcB family protein [Syntrophomonadaceae bacterium]
MLTIKGKANQAIIYAKNIDLETEKQISQLCDQDFLKDSVIRIMPDVHAGKGCTIGTTMTLKDKVVPNMVGVDIGCGMEVSVLTNKNINLEELDRTIRKLIPSGFNIRNSEHPYAKDISFSKLKSRKHLNIERGRLSIGTLGGGNHFIEVNQDSNGTLYLVIHSGSRHLGNQVAEYYQKVAISKHASSKIPRDLAYLDGQDFADYIHDMKIMQAYAVINRKAITDEIVKAMGLVVKEQFTTIHNYIDIKNMILRKGAISAQKGEKVIIPINMRDGSIIAIGKGNPDWNYSAPHGAGRVLSRKQARATLSMQEFRKEMENVYTTCINKSTLDEAPMAYKPIEEILDAIHDTVDIVDVIKPIYNFKAN